MSAIGSGTVYAGRVTGRGSRLNVTARETRSGSPAPDPMVAAAQDAPEWRWKL
jgi:hypothetical protein